MTYPGNNSLSQEIRDRIHGTFEQTLQLAEKGTRQEALLGCDFILRLDPLFEPARTLQMRLQTGDGPVEVSDVRSAMEGDGAGVSFQGLGAEIDSMDEDEGDGADLATLMQGHLEARRFKAILELAGEHGARIREDAQLRELAEAAQSRLEAAPYVRAFLESARQAISEGHSEEAERLAEKARSLDPSHPELEELFEVASPFDSPIEAKVIESDPFEAIPVLEELILPAGEVLFEDDSDEILDEPLLILEPTEEPSEESTQEVEAIVLDSEDPFADEPLSAFEDDTPAFGAREELDGAEELTDEEAALDFGFDSEPSVLEQDDAPLSLGIEETENAGDETDRRIVELLGEGQAAFDGAEYQVAIDAWSRIFLIDIDHGEAAHRIDEARRLKAEAERKIEELFRTGEASLKAGESDLAKESFQRVLEIQPNHLAAREYLDQLASGTVPMGGGPDLSSMISATMRESELDLQQEILVPPDEPSQGMGKPGSAAPAKSKVAGKQPSRRVAMLAGVVGFVVVAAAVFLFLKKDSLFPNAQDASVAQEGPGIQGPDPIDRATRLYDEGKPKVAISQLKRLRADSPHYEQAQILLSQWEASASPLNEVPDTAPTVDDIAQREALLDRARTAYAESEYLMADTIFAQAATLAPLEGLDAERQSETRKQLEPFAEQIAMKKQGDCEFIIPTLWRARDEPGPTPVPDRLLADCYYNLGVIDLQRNNLQSASEKFQEAITLRPADEEFRKAYLFSETYKKRGEDLLYRIYVKYLPSR